MELQCQESLTAFDVARVDKEAALAHVKLADKAAADARMLVHAASKEKDDACQERDLARMKMEQARKESAERLKAYMKMGMRIYVSASARKHTLPRSSLSLCLILRYNQRLKSWSWRPRHCANKGKRQRRRRIRSTNVRRCFNWFESKQSKSGFVSESSSWEVRSVCPAPRLNNVNIHWA